VTPRAAASAARALLAGLAGCVPAGGAKPDAAGAPAVTATATGGPVTAASTADAGWSLPIEGAVLPTESNLLPNAEREYRGGIHEGVDFFYRNDGAQYPCGTRILAARAGWVVRADHEWRAMPPREYEFLTGALRVKRDEAQLDRLRGRQVWIRSADGVVVRYCHLQAVAPDAAVGLQVERGTLLGLMGNTGTIDGAKGTGQNCHLHFEIWPTPAAFLGKDEGPRNARGEYAHLFGLPE